mmetsp:Transcript_73670/g.204852  ORF Transcript_73670/g.204852 Transcript_73670/m.204852 type:complete len:204 (-) Transcript_73670:2766-3377(-)
MRQGSCGEAIGDEVGREVHRWWIDRNASRCEVRPAHIGQVARLPLNNGGVAVLLPFDGGQHGHAVDGHGQIAVGHSKPSTLFFHARHSTAPRWMDGGRTHVPVVETLAQAVDEARRRRLQPGVVDEVKLRHQDWQPVYGHREEALAHPHPLAVAPADNRAAPDRMVGVGVQVPIFQALAAAVHETGGRSLQFAVVDEEFFVTT